MSGYCYSTAPIPQIVSWAMSTSLLVLCGRYTLRRVLLDILLVMVINKSKSDFRYSLPLPDHPFRMCWQKSIPCLDDRVQKESFTDHSLCDYHRSLLTTGSFCNYYWQWWIYSNNHCRDTIVLILPTTSWEQLLPTLLQSFRSTSTFERIAPVE